MPSDSPADAAEQWALARLGVVKKHCAADCFVAGTFAAGPKLADIRHAADRCNAAGCAALAIG